MKPQEILGMLEEAAGTRMYETKKEAALRTLEKKQVKVQEIEKVLLLSRSPSASTAHPRVMDWMGVLILWKSSLALSASLTENSVWTMTVDILAMLTNSGHHV